VIASSGMAPECIPRLLRQLAALVAVATFTNCELTRENKCQVK